MKNLFILFITMAMLSLVASPALAQGELAASADKAADPQGPAFLVVTKAHWNWNNKDGSPERWMELESAWHENVTMKNDLVMGAGTYYHYFSDDNSEVYFVTAYGSWNDIMESGKKSQELAKAAWPDDDERGAMWKERSSYYSPEHSDEIYASLPYAKPVTDHGDESLVYYLMKRQRDYPEDGTDEEFAEVMNEFHSNVTANNPHLKGFYTHRHAWGSDARELTIVYVLGALDDLDDMLDAQGELAEKHWPDEEERKAFFKKMNKYFTPQHADIMLRNEPKLVK